MKHAKGFDSQANGPEGTSLAFLQNQIQELEERVIRLKAEATLCQAVNVVLGHHYQWGKVKESNIKEGILKVLQLHSESLGIAKSIKHIGMSRSRYKLWRRELRQCSLTFKAASKCPNRHPRQLTASEVEAMKRLVHNESYGHFSIAALAIHAKRIGEVFVERHTWYKYIRENGWKRPLTRNKKTYKVGVRSSFRDQIWHLDVSHWEFPDGTKAFIQAVIDNFSCAVLAVEVSENISGLNTVALLKKAVHAAGRSPNVATTLLSDGGSENRNCNVEGFIRDQENFSQAIARIDIRLSNAGSECFFRSLKTNYLRTQIITGIRALEEKVKFYVDQYNRKVPHNRHSGGTPIEIYEGSWGEDEIRNLAEQSKLAQDTRYKNNVSLKCDECVIDLNIYRNPHSETSTLLQSNRRA